MDEREFFYEFGKTLYKIDGFYAEYAKKSKVKENLLWILYALNDGKSHSQKEICDGWDLPRTTVNTIVKELEASKYVELSQIKGEKRELELSLTKSGKLYAEELLKGLYEIEKLAYNAINASEVLRAMQNVLENLYKCEKELIK